MSHYERLFEFYKEGPVPWDQALPPPEVLATVPTLAPGRALDLGFGLGGASLYLAGLGWRVDGVDFIPQAVNEARVRAEKAGLAERITYHLGSVAELGFLTDHYDFALDVGCAHGLTSDELRSYQRGLLRLLKSGALYLLFAHLNDEQATPESQRWMNEAELLALFADGFVLKSVERGTTQVGDQPPWNSAWYWLRRQTA
jgi:cyclopropane fatty-acyl-phospholipid synthase-like methyltransferase